MALIKLYESAAALDIPSKAFDFEDFTTAASWGWYMRRYDCVVVFTVWGCYKLYRSGHIVRCCRGQYSGFSFLAYDSNVDKLVSLIIGGFPYNMYNDPVGMLFDPQSPASIEYSGAVIPAGLYGGVIFGQKAWKGVATSVTSHHLVTGATIDTISLTGSISPFGVDRIDITDDGWLMGFDFDNGSFGVLRAYHLATGERWTSTFDKAKFAWMDRVNKNLWVYRSSDSKLVVYQLQVAPSAISVPTMGANRCRYREDNLSVTVTGSAGEPVPNCPVEWELDTDEGHLEFDTTETDASGVATNRYCGPGADDYVGASQTITARTAY